MKTLHRVIFAALLLRACVGKVKGRTAPAPFGMFAIAPQSYDVVIEEWGAGGYVAFRYGMYGLNGYGETMAEAEDDLRVQVRRLMAFEAIDRAAVTRNNSYNS